MFAANTQAAQGIAFMVFPLTFVSSAYVPVSTIPGWMRGLANNQPFTAMVNAFRTLTLGPQAQAVLGHAAAYYVVRSLLWAAALVLAFVPVAVSRYRRG